MANGLNAFHIIISALFSPIFFLLLVEDIGITMKLSFCLSRCASPALDNQIILPGSNLLALRWKKSFNYWWYFLFISCQSVLQLLIITSFTGTGLAFFSLFTCHIALLINQTFVLIWAFFFLQLFNMRHVNGEMWVESQCLWSITSCLANCQFRCSFSAVHCGLCGDL